MFLEGEKVLEDGGKMFKLFNKKNDEENNFLISQLQALKSNNLHLKEMYNKLQRYEIKKYIKEICKTSDKLLTECINDNSKISKLNLFINYYQVDTIKIISQYISIKENNINSEEANSFIEETNVFIEKVNKAFNSILEDIVLSKEKNLDVDIKIMLENLATNNFLGDKK